VIVLDASAVVEWLLRTPLGVNVEARLLRSPVPLHAPHLLDVEIAQALRRLVAIGDISARDAEDVIADLGDLAVHRHAHDVFLWRVFELRDALTAYDAVYVALAEALGGVLLTCDRRLGGSHGHQARVEVIGAGA